MNTKSILRLSALGLGGLLVSLPATAARAAEPTTAAEAQAKAERYRTDAQHYRALGGVGYATGAVRRADADAARYDALAEKLAPSPSTTVTVHSTETEHYADLAAHYQSLGGVGEKTGLVRSAEAREQHYLNPYPAPEPAPKDSSACIFSSKPPVQFLACAGD